MAQYQYTVYCKWKYVFYVIRWIGPLIRQCVSVLWLCLKRDIKLVDSGLVAVCRCCVSTCPCVFHFVCYSIYFLNESIVCVHTTSFLSLASFLTLSHSYSLLSLYTTFCSFVCLYCSSLCEILTIHLYKRLQWQWPPPCLCYRILAGRM